MDLDSLLSLLLMLLWRVVLCLAISSVLAFFLVQWFPWMSGLQGIALALLGLAAGLVWQSHVRAANMPNVATPETPVSLVLMGMVVFGATWGLFSGTSKEAAAFGLVVLLLVAAGWRLMESSVRGVRLRGAWTFKLPMLVAGYGAGLWAGSKVLPLA